MSKFLAWIIFAFSHCITFPFGARRRAESAGSSCVALVVGQCHIGLCAGLDK